jgi:pimeloyl-ACP methyl ester carboxylesterase
VDATAHLKQNLNFLLRSATVSQAFSYDDSGEFVRQSSPASYEYSGYRAFSPGLDYSVMQELRPIQENYLWLNYVFNATNLATGADYDAADFIRTLSNPQYQFTGTASNSPSAPLAFSTTNSTWLYYRWINNSSFDVAANAEVGIGVDANNKLYLASSVHNLYGLSINSVEVALQYNDNQFSNLVAGAAASFYAPEAITYYPEVAVPSLQTVGYYFNSQTPYFSFGSVRPPVPGSPDFSVTNTTPLLITAVGQPYTVAGWAKQAITNGSAGKYAYLEQYFDKAYKLDTNGVATTNQTGIFSPYGEFFATEPGPVALVTMADTVSGQHGTGVVQVIKLQLDVNHDGIMDLSFGGPDNTSSDRPLVFWANNDYDRGHSVDCPLACDWEQDDLNPGSGGFPLNSVPDGQYTDPATGQPAIPSLRDLEDYTRLWVPGFSNLMQVTPTNYTITLSWRNNSGAAIRLFRAAETNGSTNYLFNTNTAIAQTNYTLNPCYGYVSPGQTISLSDAFRTNTVKPSDYFIFCGVSSGTDELVMQVKNEFGRVVGETSTFIELKDIKEMYERWTVGDAPLAHPMTEAVPAGEPMPLGVSSYQYPYDPATDSSTPYILLVHGWNMESWEKDRYAESAFKRLYWQGYQGRFGIFRWPTGNKFTGLIDVITDARNYDNSESNAWSSATGLLNKLNDLNAYYPGHVYLMAHSMGNVVAGEALRLAGNSQVVNTYVAMQAAIPAHCYDALTTTNSTRTPPDRYAYYYTNGAPCYFNATAGAQNYFNFYNQADYALGYWNTDQGFKPDNGLQYPGYHYSSSSSFYVIFGAGTNDIRYLTFPANTYEIFAYGDPAWSFALGAQANVGGAFKSGATYNQVDLGAAPYSFGSAHKGHSAEFRSDNMDRAVFWHTLLDKMRLLP